MNKSKIEHAMTCLGEEVGEVTQEIFKSQRLGLEFSRDKRHTNMERLQMEMADILGAFEEFMLNVTGDHDWSSKYHADMADRIHKKRMTIRMELLLKVEMGMDTVPPQYFNHTVDFYSRTEWWFEECHQLNYALEMPEDEWIHAKNNLDEFGKGLKGEAANGNNPYVKVILSHFESLQEKELCPFPHNFIVVKEGECATTH